MSFKIRLNFLTSRFNSGLSYKAINLHMSVILVFHINDFSVSTGQHPLLKNWKRTCCCKIRAWTKKDFVRFMIKPEDESLFPLKVQQWQVDMTRSLQTYLFNSPQRGHRELYPSILKKLCNINKHKWTSSQPHWNLF